MLAIVLPLLTLYRKAKRTKAMLLRNKESWLIFVRQMSWKLQNVTRLDILCKTKNPSKFTIIDTFSFLFRSGMACSRTFTRCKLQIWNTQGWCILIRSNLVWYSRTKWTMGRNKTNKQRYVSLSWHANSGGLNKWNKIN